jgi:hypothetical protein
MSIVATKMVEMCGVLVEVKVCAPSKRKAAGSIQGGRSVSSRRSGVNGVSQQMRDSRNTGKPGYPIKALVRQVQKHISHVPISLATLEHKSMLPANTFKAVLDYLREKNNILVANNSVTSKVPITARTF